MSSCFFNKKVPDGCYAVSLELGSINENSDFSLWAGNRCLYINSVRLKAGEFRERTLNISIRTPSLDPLPPGAPGGRRVLLQDYEENSPDWNGQLQLFTLGKKTHARVLSCARTESISTLFLLGDSTVANQHDEAYASWGQMLGAFVHPDIAIANHAQSGETLKSFISSLRLAKVLESVRPGDYALIQFGHNDQKEAWPQSYLPAETGFKTWLRAYIAEFRYRGVQVLLATSPERLAFDNGGKIIPSHGKYPAVVRALAREEKLPLLDLESLSRSLYESTGPEKAHTLFAPDDCTHHNSKGACELAKLLAAELYTFIPEARPTAEKTVPDG